jgi:hypothetical protein
MKKKIVFALVAAGTAVAVLPLFAAFEAHVINVTAKIENALSVPLESINFGTVFPQEHLNLPLDVALSQSFLDETRVDDVEYIIRQKPKCGVTSDNGTVLVGPTWTGHVNVDPTTGEVTIDCDADQPDGLQLVIGEVAGLLPSLCEYISKHPDEDESQQNDGSLNSFHMPYSVVGNGTDTPFAIAWNDTLGRLAKSDSDLVDDWTIDLAVPCFGDHCAQDWAAFVESVNPGADPDKFVQDINNEHKIFGCNLWVEVTGVSETEIE